MFSNVIIYGNVQLKKKNVFWHILDSGEVKHMIKVKNLTLISCW